MPKIEVTDLKAPSKIINDAECDQLPDDFDMEDCVRIGMYSIALAFGVHPDLLQDTSRRKRDKNVSKV